MRPDEAAAAAFEARFGVGPAAVVSAPGRVNLIGEHTDYSLLPVLAVAIDRRVVVAIGPGRAGIIDADSTVHPGPVQLAVGTDPTSVSGWHRYLAAAGLAAGGSGSASMIIGGDLPTQGGLSSSSALTIALLRSLSANDPETATLAGRGLVEAAVRAERSVGVEGGAMDQTVAVLAEKGHALRIDFDPWGTRAVAISDNIAFVAAYSGEPARKGSTARHAYNRSVVSCRAAAALIAAQLGIDAGDPPLLGRIARHEVAIEVAAGLPAEMTAAAAAAASDRRMESIVGLSLAGFDPEVPLAIRASAVHVLSEAQRVDQAELAVAAGELGELGRLFDASHTSLTDFGATTGGLDRLVAAMRAAGAAGARLTGAGFGGYTVAACRPDQVESILDAARAATGGPAFEVVAAEGVR